MSESTPVVVPQENPNDEHAVLVCWHVGLGDLVAAEQTLATVETTKATFDVQAPRAGYVFFEQLPKTMVAVGATIAWISDSKDAPRLATPAAAAVETVQTGSESRFSRKALRLMSQYGLSEADVPASGRIETADVERVVTERKSTPKTAVPKPTAPKDAEPLEQSASKMLEVARLSEVYRSAIPSTVSVVVSCEKTNLRLQRIAIKLSPISMLELCMCEISRLLAAFPDLNGYYENDRAWRYSTISVGFAVNLGHSLRVPIVRSTAELSQIEIARAVRDLSLRYMRNELTTADVTGGTFTITDLSGHDVVHFVPVLNDRQSAILGICAERPGTGSRELVLSFDHRMADGMRAATFLGELRERLEADSVD